MVPQSFAGKSEADAFKQIEAQLRGVRLAERRKQFLSDLRRRPGVEILLPEPVRPAMAAGDDPAAGPVNTLVTRSYCRNGDPIIWGGLTRASIRDYLKVQKPAEQSISDDQVNAGFRPASPKQEGSHRKPSS